jgi:uncharacterized repeat protein (TIGR02543 family)
MNNKKPIKKHIFFKSLISITLSLIFLLTSESSLVVSFASEDLEFFDQLEVMEVHLNNGEEGSRTVWFDGTNFLDENPNMATGIEYPSSDWTVSKSIAGTAYEVTVDIPRGAFDRRVGFYARSVGSSDLTSAQRAAVNSIDMPHDNLEYLDIGFKDVSGNEVEPLVAVGLTITMKDKAKEASDNGDNLYIDVYHIDESAGTTLEKVASIDEKAEVVDEAIENVGGISVNGNDIVATIEATSFSIFVINNATTSKKITFSKNEDYLHLARGTVSGTMKPMMVSVPAVPGTSVTLTPNAYVYTGHVFTKWNTKADGTGDDWLDGDTKTITTDTTLYAQWTGHDHTGYTPIVPDAEGKFDPTGLAAGKYYLTANTTFTAQFNVSGGTVLCLNGYTLTVHNDVASPPIVVGGGATFELDDCNASGNGKGKITGGKAGCISITGGSFIMDGGVITGTTGDAIKMTSGTIKIYNGSINSSSGAGIYLQGGTATLLGGTITANRGSGVNVQGGTCEIEGIVKITGNTSGGSKSNVYLKNGKKLAIVNPLSSGTVIGISMETAGVFTTNYGYTDGENKGVDPAAFFISDSDDYEVVVDGSEGSLAAPTHVHCLHGVHSTEDVSFKRWASTDSLPTEGGNYFLVDNVTISGTWHITGTVRLCLNNHKISWDGGSSRMIVISDGGNLYLTDCNLNDQNHSYSVTNPIDGSSYTVEGGIITGNSEGGCVYVENGTFNMYNGTIAGNRTTEDLSTSNGGGAVLVTGSASFYMYDGALKFNEASYCGGGAVRARGSGNVRIIGGTISNNKGAWGGGISVAQTANLSVSGGDSTTISYNLATSVDSTDRGGGAIIFGTGYSGNATISGGNIIGNRSYFGGGGIQINTGTLNMSGGTVTGNTTTGSYDSNGGGIYIGNGATLNLTGSPSISGNTATSGNSSNGGGIYFSPGATLNMKDSPYVLGNVASSDGSATTYTSNVYLPQDTDSTKYNITITGSLNGSGPNIGVTKPPKENESRTRFTTGYGFSDSSVNNEDGTASTRNNIAKQPNLFFSSDIYEPNDPTKPSYFVKLYTDNCEAMLAGDYIVEYDLDGGTWKDTVEDASHPESVFFTYIRNEVRYYAEHVSSVVPTKATEPKEPEKEDYVFTGWEIVEGEASTIGDEYVFGNNVTQDIKLIATWESELNEFSYSGGLVGYAGSDVTFDNCDVSFGEGNTSEATGIRIESTGFNGYGGGLVGFVNGSLNVTGGTAVNSSIKGYYVGGMCGGCSDGESVSVSNDSKVMGHILMMTETINDVDVDLIPYRTMAGEIVGRKEDGDSLNASTRFLFYDETVYESINTLKAANKIDQVVRPNKRFYQPDEEIDPLEFIGVTTPNQ